MTCPSCNQSPSSLLRHAFSLQGVSFIKSLQGYFRCQHCGTHLRVVRFGKQFWFFFLSTVVVLVLFLFLFGPLFASVGPSTTVLIWFIVVLLAVSIFDFGMWKYGTVEKVEPEIASATKRSV